MRPLRRLLTALLACALLAACSGDGSALPTGTSAPPTSAASSTSIATTTTVALPTTTTGATTTTLGGSTAPVPTALPARAVFASFNAVPLLEAMPAAIPDHPTSLEGVYWDFKVPEELRARLAADGFALTSAWSSDVLHSVYSYWARYADGPVYVTADAGYHEWHLVFSKALRDTEEQALLPLLEGLVAGMAAFAPSLQAADPALAEAKADVVLWLEALGTVLGLPVAASGDERVAQEVALVEEHAAVAISPTLGVDVDYTLMAPRGHYTRSDALTRYFRAMAMLGGTPFPLDSPDALRRGAVLSALIVANADLRDAWQRIYDTTSFLVGAADDYTPVEVMAAFGTGGLATLDDTAMGALAATLAAARPVLIDAESASVRVMGARFVLDAFLLDQLVHPQVWQRLEASVLDVAAAFGSDWALAQQEAAGVPASYPQYAERIAALRALVAERPLADWGSTVYDAWLYAILPMWQSHETPFPDYMRTAAWSARAHQAGFGSYTEMKHDTVLYAKQAFAEGDQDLPPAPPRHWVEPDPVPFERLAEAARLLRTGLAERGLLPEATDELLDGLIAMEERFGRIARDELAVRPISPEDNDWLATIGTTFELLWLQAGEGEAEHGGASGFAQDPDSRAPVVVDIFSNPTDALEIATGGFDTIYVLVPNDEGQFQVAVGAAYAFYEFWVPRGERMTDEEWRALLSEGNAPARPSWLAALYG